MRRAGVEEVAEDIHRDQLIETASLVVGSKILDIVTSGMYSDPLMVIREYVQNSCDAIDQAAAVDLIDRDEGTIEVSVDGRSRNLSLRDNGIGVPARAAKRVLCGVGLSTKPTQAARGFRGVGRLGGLGYCRKLVFETRYRGEDTVTALVWDTAKLRTHLRETGELCPGEGMGDALTVLHRTALESDPDHFFCVTMEGVKPFHRDVLMDVSRIRGYLGEVAPVDFDSRKFPHANTIREQFSELDGFRCYSVSVNGRDVLRPHRAAFSLSKSAKDQVESLRVFTITDVKGNTLGKGWFANTSFLASLPSTTRMRGVRLRQGNLQVGDEGSLEGCFSEKRFATWHVGEIHLNYVVTPNARRDGFEHTLAYEAVLEFCQRLGKHLSQLCRKSSVERTALARSTGKIESLLQFLESPFFVDVGHMEECLSQSERQLDGVNEALPGPLRRQVASSVRLVRDRLAAVKLAPVFLADRIDTHLLCEMRGDELLRQLCIHLANGNGVPRTRAALLEEVIAPFAR